MAEHSFATGILLGLLAGVVIAGYVFLHFIEKRTHKS